MPDEAPAAVDPYDAVLADLRAKREEIDRVISTLEAFRSGTSAAVAPIASRPQVGPASVAAVGPGAFLGMTIVDAARVHLAAQRRPMGNAELFSAFKAGGLVLTSADPVNVISSVLVRRFNNVGDIVRVERGTWGLAEWYPNRSFKKKPAKGIDAGSEPDPRGEPNAAEAAPTGGIFG